MDLKEVRHGSPIFYELLNKMAETHNKKSHDYASNDNPSGNYHFAGQLALLFSHSEQDAGFVGRIGEKIYRLANLEKGSKTPLNESIDDTEIDICVITCLWMADRRKRRNEAQLVQEVASIGMDDPWARAKQSEATLNEMIKMSANLQTPHFKQLLKQLADFI